MTQKHQPWKDTYGQHGQATCCGRLPCLTTLLNSMAPKTSSMVGGSWSASANQPPKALHSRRRKTGCATHLDILDAPGLAVTQLREALDLLEGHQLPVLQNTDTLWLATSHRLDQLVCICTAVVSSDLLPKVTSCAYCRTQRP